MKKKNDFYKNKSDGFTIIETMIAVSLFIVITTVGMGALLNANLLYQKSRDMRSILDNLNYVMEDLSRNARTGYNYHCFLSTETIPTLTSAVPSTPQSCENENGWAVAFESAYGDTANYDDQWVYYIDNSGKLFRSTLGPYTASSFTQMTSDEITLDTTKSYVRVYGAEPPGSGDSRQPLLVIRLVGTISYQNVTSPFSIQTTVSQRLLDI